MKAAIPRAAEAKSPQNSIEEAHSSAQRLSSIPNREHLAQLASMIRREALPTATFPGYYRLGVEGQLLWTADL